MKATVTKYLNVRVGEPSVNAPCYHYLAPGSEVEIDGKLYKGDEYKDTNLWVKDLANNYYWRGGIEMPIETRPVSQKLSNNEIDNWWIKDFKIDELWDRGLTGKDIKIAVLDSGIFISHPDLTLVRSQIQDFSQSRSGVLDQIGHGTHVAGIIKASSNEFGVTGVAYNSSFFFGKITNDLKGDKLEYLVKAIRWATTEKIDIVSISEGFTDESQDLRNAIEEAKANNILLICAAGNKDDTTGNNLLFPARYDGVLSIGGLTRKHEPLIDSINVNQTNLFAPGEEILSTYLDSKYLSMSGSSQATPFVAGVAGLILESKRKTNPAYQAINLRNDLLELATTTSYGKKINPLKLLQ